MADTESDGDAAALQKMIDAGLVVAAAEPGPMPTPRWRPVAVTGKPVSKTIIEDRGERAKGRPSMIQENRPPTHPGEMLLEEFLQPLGMTQSEAARRMEIPLNRLNEVIRGRRGITADTALRLAKLLNTDPEIWMNLQNQWDLWHAARSATRAS